MRSEDSGARVVVVTGGSSGIGRAMAEAFAQRGDQVVITGRREDGLKAAAEGLGLNGAWERADVTQRAEVSAAIEAIANRFGRIDVLINNAGGSSFGRGLSQATPLDLAQSIWEEEIGVNLTGAFLMTMAALPYVPRPGGRIIFVSSDAALTGGPGLRLAGYVAAKAGLFGLARALAVELRTRKRIISRFVGKPLSQRPGLP